MPSGEYNRHIATFIAAVGILVTLYVTFARPALHGEMRTIADQQFEKRLEAHDALRNEQIRELRKSIDRMSVRLDRIDSNLAEELMRISSTLLELSDLVKEK